ncbi:hypothetical protein chiPu_0002545 [Chiloscyllium punctatum]|uniref:Uncharacterized protein n=1 Tax=Chiloscyllium punctatum TaxID=137246 RepID=A0A401S181_CHIPU|nr:hypothetical protein [Chiloscyllium punctatum]
MEEPSPNTQSETLPPPVGASGRSNGHIPARAPSRCVIAPDPGTCWRQDAERGRRWKGRCRRGPGSRIVSLFAEGAGTEKRVADGRGERRSGSGSVRAKHCPVNPGLPRWRSESGRARPGQAAENLAATMLEIKF